MSNSENPLGIKAIDHLEFVAESQKSETFELFKTMGMSTEWRSNEADRELLSQGQIRFVFHTPQNSDKALSRHGKNYLEKHGEGVSRLSFWVDNCEEALSEALKRGAELKEDLTVEETEAGTIKRGAIQGFGDVLNEFVERPNTLFATNGETVKDAASQPLSTRCSRIDHLTNNVPKGEMEHWVEFYKRVYGMKETRYFDIKGVKTGLQSKVVQLANNQVIIPINEPEAENGKSQIQEFLDRHNGPGVQHIALMTPDIISTLADLQNREMKFLKIPDTYYEEVKNRVPLVTEDIETLRKHQILVDGDDEGYLLQIFSETYIGPLFFEYIQRKKHWGFGEGNFQALFDAIERDQERRGYL